MYNVVVIDSVNKLLAMYFFISFDPHREKSSLNKDERRINVARFAPVLN